MMTDMWLATDMLGQNKTKGPPLKQNGNSVWLWGLLSHTLSIRIVISLWTIPINKAAVVLGFISSGEKG